MAVLTDHQVGWIPEGTYGTPLTVTRFAELVDGTFDFDPQPIQGMGMWVGSPRGVLRADRRIAGLGRGKLSIIVQALSKGLGTLLQAGVGTGVSTLVSGSTQQQLFTPTITTSFMPSLTVQAGIVDNTGTVNAETFAGCTVTDWQLELPVSAGADAYAKWTFNLDAKTLATATGLATFVGPSSPSLYTWVGAGTLGSASVKVGGAVTPATTTALASSSGAVSTLVGAITLKSDNNLNIDDRPGVGGWNQPTAGAAKHTLSFTWQYDASTYRALQISQGNTAFLLDIPTSEALSTGTAELQVAIPAMKVNTGAMPQPSHGQTVTTPVEAEILWDGTNQPFQIIQRTADTTL